MFYCERCREKNDWPDSLTRSYAPCEVCKKTAMCFDRPSYSLPKKKESNMKNIRGSGIPLIEYAIIAIFLSIILGSCMGGINGCYDGYSDGARSGVVVKLSKKGLMMKSWEGELLVGGMTSDTGGTAVPRSWPFSIQDDTVASEVQKACDEGRRVTLHYKQYWIKPWKTDTDYKIIRVENTVK